MIHYDYSNRNNFPACFCNKPHVPGVFQYSKHSNLDWVIKTHDENLSKC